MNEASASFFRGSNSGRARIRAFYLKSDNFDLQELSSGHHKLLNEEERCRFDRFMFDHSKREFLLGRVMLKSALGKLLHLEPDEVRFQIGEDGKLSLEGAEAKALQFNLTHTRGIVACAFAHRVEIGIDAEVIDPLRAQSGIAQRFFSVPEIECLATFKGDEYSRVFYQIWTLKEAYIKAKGLGLSLPLKQFHMQLPPVPADPIGIGFAPESDDDSGFWQFQSLQPTPDHFLSIAVYKQHGPPLEITTTELFSPDDISSID